MASTMLEDPIAIVDAIDIDSDGSSCAVTDDDSTRGKVRGSCPESMDPDPGDRMKPRKRRRSPNGENGRSVLHVKRHQSWAERLHERGIHEFTDPDFGRLKKRAQYLDSGRELDSEDEQWWLENQPPAVVNESKMRHSRDRPPYLSQAKIGDEVFISRGNKGAFKGTVVQEDSDTDGDDTVIRPKYVRAAVRLKHNGQVKRFRRSRLRNRMVHLANLPAGWTGCIRLDDVHAKSPQGRLLVKSPHFAKPFSGSQEELAELLRRPEISRGEFEAVEASCKEGWQTARAVWGWLFPREDDSESSSEQDYGGEFCARCGEGGGLVECDAKGCTYSMHRACLENAPGEGEEWYCECCRQETFLLNRSVHAHVRHGPGVEYVHTVFGKPVAGPTDVQFELPRMLQPPAEYALGVVYGSSGSGKSLILEKRFGHRRKPPEEWERGTAIIELVHPDPPEAMERLIASAIESQSDMVKPYHVLSDGQKMRARVAKALRSGAVIDEFASCLDYTVVHSLCRGVSRFVREKALSKVVVASCHPKVVEWLRPDWSFNTDTGILQTYPRNHWPRRQPHAVLGAAAAVRAKLARRGKGQREEEGECVEVSEEEESDAETVGEERADGDRDEGGEAQAWGGGGRWAGDKGEETGRGTESAGEEVDGMEVQGEEVEGDKGEGAREAGGGEDEEGAQGDGAAESGEEGEGEGEGEREGEGDGEGEGRPVTLRELRGRPWISPDMHFDPSVLELQIEVAEAEVWDLFRGEHYKAGSHIKGAHVYVASVRDGAGQRTPAGLVAVRPQPGRGNNPATRTHSGWYRESRVVVLKVWQGVGIGCAISDAIAEAYKEANCIYTSSFLHPRLHKHREASRFWLPTSSNMQGGYSFPAPGKRVYCAPKFSYEFVGEDGGQRGQEQAELGAGGERREKSGRTAREAAHQRGYEADSCEEDEDEHRAIRILGGGGGGEEEEEEEEEEESELEDAEEEEASQRTETEGGRGSVQGRATEGSTNAETQEDSECVAVTSAGEEGDSDCVVPTPEEECAILFVH